MASGSPTMNKIEKAHQLYREGKYSEALRFYTEALSVAKTKPQKIALHSNRAACYLKLHDFHKAAEECTAVLELDHKHTGALMLRAQTLVTLKEYNCALFDVNRLMELNPLSEVYKNLQARLKTQLSLATIPEEDGEFEEEEDDDDEYMDEANSESEHDNEGARHFEVGMDVNNNVAVPEINKSENAPPSVPTEDKTRKIQMQPAPDRPTLEWQKIPKPKGHSQLDYSRWDRVEDDSSEEESDDDSDDDTDSRPQYRFRVKNVGVRAVN